MFYEQPIFYAGFLAFVVILLALDLGVLNRRAHAPSLKEAGLMSALWVSIAMAVGGFVYFYIGSRQALEYYTGYILEQSLSVDNLFVFVLIFSFFRVPAQYHHRVLFWGIIGAIAMRLGFILLGAVLIQKFDVVLYVFGLFLIYTGIRIGVSKDDDEPEMDKNPLLRLAKRVLPITSEYHEDKFAIRQAGKLIFTPLLLVLIIVESTDLVFAVDSIPAVIAVTKEPFIIFISNVMAVLGLRALYFLLAGAMDQFYYLKPALSVILTFVGVKMVGEKLFHAQLHTALLNITSDPENFISIASLVFILAVLAVAVIASLLRGRSLPKAEPQSQ